MIYGMYQSAAGVMTNSYKQDVIANNLANSETVGFKRDLARFQERPPASTEQPGKIGWTNPKLDAIGGGTFAMPTAIDTSTGSMEHTGNTLDNSIDGPGFFSIDDHGQQRLTRNGQFMLDKTGNLVMTNHPDLKVLDANGKPIKLDGDKRDSTAIGIDGTVTQDGEKVAQMGIFDLTDPAKLQKQGGSLFSFGDYKNLAVSGSPVRSGYIEKANVDPTIELTDLMQTQRQLEANANMIHYQDDTLDKLINTVGKIS